LKYGATVGAAEGCDLLIFSVSKENPQGTTRTARMVFLPAQSAAFLKLKDRSLRQLLPLEYGATVGAAEGCDLLIFRARKENPQGATRTARMVFLSAQSAAFRK